MPDVIVEVTEYTTQLDEVINVVEVIEELIPGPPGPPGADGGLSGDIALAVGTTTITGGTTARLLSVGSDGKLDQTNPNTFDAAGTAAAAVTAHLGGDQHTQYVLANGTRAFTGDLLVGSEDAGAKSIQIWNAVEGEYAALSADDNGINFGGTINANSFKASSYQGLTWNDVTLRPTTLSGYGITDAVALSLVGAKNGVASLDSSGQVPAAQIPAIAITEYLGQVANQSAMLALVGQKGDWCIRTDSGAVWIITGDDPTLLASWTQVSYPASPVSSVAGRTGDVTLSAADVDGLSKVATTNSYLDLSNIPTEFTPASHKHGNITNAGAIGSTANLPVITGADGVLVAGAFGSTANTFCQGNDSRLSDARTPTSHASSHGITGSDPLAPEAIHGAVTVLGTSGTINLDLSVSRNYVITPTGAVTLTTSNDADGKTWRIRVESSSFSVTWPGTIRWAGGAPTQPVPSGKALYVGFIRTSSGKYDAFPTVVE